MSAIYSAVVCEEEFATQAENWNDEGNTPTVVLRTPWAMRHLLVNDLIGNRRPWPFGGFTIQPTAKTCGILPDETQYIANGQTIEYIDALVTVGYDNSEGTDLLSESLEPVTEFVTQDHKRFRWGAADGPPLLEAEAPGQISRLMNIVRTHYEVPSPLHLDLIDLAGLVNNAALTSATLGFTYAAETLLYSPPALTRKITTDGVEGWTITIKYTYNPNGWNKYWRASTQTWVGIWELGGNEYKSYVPADFSNVWNVV